MKKIFVLSLLFVVVTCQLLCNQQPLYNHSFPVLIADGVLDGLLAQDTEEDLPASSWPPRYQCTNRLECDYIIVGLGTAGSVVVNRLSENPNLKICGFEKGYKNPSEQSEPPLTAAFAHFEPQTSRYRAQPQYNFAKGFRDQRVQWPMGNVVGGTSQINYMICTRGSAADWDSISRYVNDTEWNWAATLEDYKRSEKANDLTWQNDTVSHSTTGKLSISDSRYYSERVEEFLQAGAELGFPSDFDYNNGYPYGFSRIQTTTYKGRRADAKFSYLDEASMRPNVTIITNAYVTRVFLKPNQNITSDRKWLAYGVEYVKDGILCQALARREVILSANTRNDAKILMLSGIGPAQHLNQFNIPVYKNLPAVGQYITDHLAFFGGMIQVNQRALKVFDILNPIEWNNYNCYGTGVFSSIGSIIGIGYINTEDNSTLGRAMPNMEFLHTFGFFTSDTGLGFAKAWGIDQLYFLEYFGTQALKNIIGIIPSLLKPLSRSYMKLASANPYIVPKFYGNYFTDPQGKDLKALIAGYKFMVKMVNTAAYRKVGAQVVPIPAPGCGTFSLSDDRYIECLLRTFTTSFNHQCGSCRMGSSEADSVTNSRGLVHGIQNLRIIDLSILPEIPGAHTYCVAIMIGEKGARFILQDLAKNTP